MLKWGPVRVGALSGLGPCPGWGPYGPIGPLWAHKGPYGPIGPSWAHMGPYGPDFILKLLSLIKYNKIINKNIKVVKLKILKVKTWFGDKDLSSLDSINKETHKGKYMDDNLSLIHI